MLMAHLMNPMAGQPLKKTTKTSGSVSSRSTSCGVQLITTHPVPLGGYPAPQGPYYCSVGASNAHGRDCVDEHLDACLEAGINVEGINAEVAAGQWEFQVFAKGAKRAGDEIWVARYLLERIGENMAMQLIGIRNHLANRLERVWHACQLLK